MTTTPALSVCVLGSSSAGNCTVVWTSREALLVDCGFPPRYILRHLSSLGIPPDQITGVLITHIHGDHINNGFVRKAMQLGLRLYCPAEISLHMQGAYRTVAEAAHRGLVVSFSNGGLELDAFDVRSFPVPHDSPGGCFGYRISTEANGREVSMAIATDIAVPDPSIVPHFQSVDIMVIESNHDVRMLEESRRPMWLKRRIRERGHLSNNECANLLQRVLDTSRKPPSAIQLAHISRQCNTRELALATAGEELDRRGSGFITLDACYRHRPASVLRV